MIMGSHHSWVIMKRSSHDDDDTSDLSRSSLCSSDNLMEDASSSSSLSSNGPLYELSELMAHLPIKRGLSKCFQGKSQSFTNLAMVKNKEDLVKKESPYRKKMKSKSYGEIRFDTNHKYSHSPKASIAKKVSRNRGSFLFSNSLMGERSAGSLLGSFRSSIYVQNKHTNQAK